MLKPGFRMNVFGAVQGLAQLMGERLHATRDEVYVFAAFVNLFDEDQTTQVGFTPSGPTSLRCFENGKDVRLMRGAKFGSGVSSVGKACAYARCENGLSDVERSHLLGDLRSAYCGKRAILRLQLCEGCLKVSYCCKQHQKLDWEFHKLSCVREPHIFIQQHRYGCVLRGRVS